MNQLRVGTDLRLTCLLGDSLLAELNDQQYNTRFGFMSRNSHDMTCFKV